MRASPDTSPVLLILLLLSAPPAAAQELRLTGQLRPRFEQREPAFPAPLGDVTMRARVGVAGALPEDVRLRIEVQDVVIWGGGAGTPGFSTAAEVHQAFVDVGGLGAALTARIGRQEIAIGNQRLISNNNWGQRGQRFDGARLLHGGVRLPGGVFAVRIAESGTGDGLDAWFHGGHAAIALQPADTLVLYGLYNRERGPTDTDQYTLGGHGTLTLGSIVFDVEAYLQRGTRRTRSVRAYMLSAGAGTALPHVRVRAAYDHYSGDADPLDATARVFDRLFGSNHAFHGYADLFTQIPISTGGHGLGDLLLRANVRLDERSTLELSGHAFRATAAGPLASARFGEELDIVLRHRPRTPLALEAGGSRFRTGPALSALRGLARDLTFGYAMMTLSF